VAFVAKACETETKSSGREGIEVSLLGKRIGLLAVDVNIVITGRRPVYTDPILSLHSIFRATIED
jgi:hypothetical protein